MNKKPNVAILLATFNGNRWISGQIKSILSQKKINIKIFISDDGSTDGTLNYIQKIVKVDSRLVLLPQKKATKSSAKNFFRLISEVDVSKFDFVGFSDQDNLWTENKIYRHINLLKLKKVDGISSNVLAFWPNGQKKIINKSQPMKRYDYLFESAGPGCSFLITPWLFSKTKYHILTSKIIKEGVMHDWLIYAICRS